VDNRSEQSLLRSDDALLYWDQRHARSGALQSGGDLGLDDATNHAFYLRRVGMLLELIDQYLPLVEPVFALDAGCGKGFVAGQLEQCGVRVVGVDASAIAVAHCRARHPGVYVQSRLDAFEYPDFFDCVYAIDVMFDIVDDAMWAASFTNLASLTRPGGVLLVTDHDGPARVPHGDHVVYRPAADYVGLAAPYGLRYDGFRPYNFRNNPAGFHAFVRSEVR
jgi:SAM-dependent methyltransferase